ncbi:MAG: Nudix family hydrolase [Gammaproteobacteria bacterium]|nr:Nudix family hydrolase [Gammaproteobacteria bacterium]
MRNTEVKAATPIHVVAGLIRHPKNSSRFFFTRRQKGQHLENLWEFPGGKVETGESRFHALQRELKEETGIQVHSALPFYSLTHLYEDKAIYLDVWEVKNFSGYAHGREGQRSTWLMQQDFSQYPFPEADLPVLKALSLPSTLLITPEFTELEAASMLLHFTGLMRKHRYRRVLFRSHLLDDNCYLDLAIKLKQICALNNAELIISRPEWNALNSVLFVSFKRWHIDSALLSSFHSNAMDESIILSATCHNKTELEMAQKFNCDFALLSVFKGISKSRGSVDQGWFQFNKVTQQFRIPVFAFEGVQRKDLTVARYQGAIGVAGTSDFW